MHTRSKSKVYTQMHQTKVHEGIVMTAKRGSDYQPATMKTSVSTEQLDSLTMVSMAAILNCDPKNATFSEIWPCHLRMHISKVFKFEAMFGIDLTNDPDLEKAKDQLFLDFKAYLQSSQHLSSKPTGIFGRDVTYERPNSAKAANLRHVHVLPLSALTSRHQASKFHQTSDVHLVYCIDDTKGHACAIALLKPAHTLANDHLFLSKLAEIAEQFFSRN